MFQRLVAILCTMRLVNLTPHAVTLIASNGSQVVVQPSGSLARVATTEKVVGNTEIEGLEFPIVATQFGEVQGLPEQEEGTMYLVSALVKEAAAARGDLVSPGAQVRNEQGQVVGCKSLSCKA